MFAPDIVFRYVLNSNRLDGIMLSDEQTKGLLEGTLPIPEESEISGPDGKEWHVESVLSHRKALERMSELATQGSAFTEELVLSLHKELMGEILLAAGEYRECTLKYRGVLIPSPPETIKPRMDALITLANRGLEKTDKKDQLAWRIHHEFITIHPFIEANGRMARLLMNFVRLRSGLDLAIVRFEDREKYSKAILEFQQHKLAKAGAPPNPNAKSSGTTSALGQLDSTPGV